MSRYFTTPPPVYARNWANGQNLVESTKMERQVISKKSHRKEKKEKKEKKRSKNEKSLKLKYVLPTKQVLDESEQLEKSCLTEEHEQQHQTGYLSDGSQSSKKRRCESSSTTVRSTQMKVTSVPGNPFRIRFILKKPNETEVVPQDDRVCSTSGTERPGEVQNTVSVPKTCENDVNLVSTSVESNRIAIPSESKKRKKHKQSKESLYNSLFDDWVPPCLSLKEDDSNSDDWLFGTKKQQYTSTKASIKNYEDSNRSLQTSGDCSVFPRAQFLPEVGIFSLPYTVPF